MSNERKNIPPGITMSSRVYKDLVNSFRNDPSSIANAVSNYEATLWAEDYRLAGLQAQEELNILNTSSIHEPVTREHIPTESLSPVVQPPTVEPFPTIEELKERARLREQALGDHDFYVSVEKKIK